MRKTILVLGAGTDGIIAARESSKEVDEGAGCENDKSRILPALDKSLI